MDNICLAPWFTLYIGSLFIKPCCIWNINPQNISEHSWKGVEDIQKIWDGNHMQEVRKKFLEGVGYEHCFKCLSRITSRKTWIQERIGRYIKEERINLNPPMKPLHVEIQLGNKCNLQCRTCRSYCSSSWIKDDYDLNEIDQQFDRRSSSEYKLDVSFKDCKEMFLDVIRFDFKGGEPMLHNNGVEILENLVKWGVAPKIILGYVTNGSVINKHMMNLWHNFKEVKVIMSIDGTDGLFKYIRGYNFSKFEENLKTYERVENLKGSYNTAISTYNILDLAEINHWIMTRHLKRFSCLDTGGHVPFECNVTDPTYLDVRILPREYKELALDRVYKYDYINVEPLAKWLKSIIDIPANEKQLKLFVSFTREMDRIKGTNFLDIKPEFNDLFEEYS